MATTMRQPTLETLGLGTVIDILQKGKLPATSSDLVDQVFGPSSKRGSMVISGANGIVGAGKTMQLGTRLLPYDIPIIALDFAGTKDGITEQYPGLASSFGRETANQVMKNIIRFNYDGKKLPSQLLSLSPKFLLEAIPEILDIKKVHYALFRNHFPDIEIRSVTSGFPSSELGVGIAHPAFPHQINKVWEVVESKPSAITQLYWSLGLLPIPVSDNWSFVLDVLFCGITNSALRYHEATNMPYWKIDKFVRRLLGPNPLRAHDAIGAKGADFLSWSCLHHLSKEYGGLFTPTDDLSERKDTGQTWYPPNHFRPLVNWSFTDEEERDFNSWLLGPVIQMTALMLYEKRAHLSHMNAIGELCAQFRLGVLAAIRKLGSEKSIKKVEDYHRLYPKAKNAWYPAAFELLETKDWQQLYVNAEHQSNIGVITISRESYNQDVDDEINRAIDWLKAEAVASVILTGDFHLSTQMVGADTSAFYGAIDNEKEGIRIADSWSRTARRLNDEFKTSVGLVVGKRCLGGFLELMMHCHYLVSVKNADLGMPEVSLPVVPGMEACHWSFRKAESQDWPKLLDMLLTGRSQKAKNTIGWLTDFAGTTEEAIQKAWSIASEAEPPIKRRKLSEGPLKDIGEKLNAWHPDQKRDEGQQAIAECIKHSCKLSLGEALPAQAKHSAAFMQSSAFREGRIGTEYQKTILV